MSTPIVRRRKRPVEVDTLACSGREADLPAVRAFLGTDLVGTEETGREGEWSLLIRTMERGAEPDVIPPGWVLIRGVRGEHYACEPGVLADTYDEVDTGFFQPGHTYATSQGFRFACLAVGPTPWDGTARAVGYLTHPDGSGHVHGLAREQWADGTWDDIAEDGRS